MHKTLIVLNTPSAIKEVIDKHASSTSNRPVAIIPGMLLPEDTNLGTAHTGEILFSFVIMGLGGDQS
jgi:hypothetical protein